MSVEEEERSSWWSAFKNKKTLSVLAICDESRRRGKVVLVERVG
jgi:hypothetical protein